MKEEGARHHPSSILDLTHFIMFLCSVNYYPFFFFFYIFKCLCWCLLVSIKAYQWIALCWVLSCLIVLLHPYSSLGVAFCFMFFLLQSLYFCSYYEKKTVKLSLFWNMEVTVWKGSEVEGCLNIGAEYTENWLLGASYNLLSECCITR